MITQGSLTWLLERIHRAGFQERRILMSCWIFFSFFSFFSFLFFISFLPSLLSLIMADSIRRVPPLHYVHILDAVLFPFPLSLHFSLSLSLSLPLCSFVPLFLSSSSLRLRLLLLILECKSSFLFSFLFFFFSFCQSVERLKVKGNLRFSSLSSSNLLLLQHLLQHLILSFSFLSF